MHLNVIFDAKIRNIALLTTREKRRYKRE